MSLPDNQLCSVDQFLMNYDSRRVCQLLTDTGIPADLASLSTNTTLLQLLSEASEMVRAAVQIRNKYTNLELTSMANSLYQGYLLRRLVCDLAYGLLNFRRGVPAQDVSKLCPGWIIAQQHLAQLRNGDELFPIYVEETDPTTHEVILDDQVHQVAGLPSLENMATNPTAGFCTISQRTNNSLFPGNCGGCSNQGCGSQ